MFNSDYLFLDADLDEAARELKLEPRLEHPIECTPPHPIIWNPADIPILSSPFIKCSHRATNILPPRCTLAHDIHRARVLTNLLAVHRDARRLRKPLVVRVVRLGYVRGVRDVCAARACAAGGVPAEPRGGPGDHRQGEDPSRIPSRRGERERAEGCRTGGKDADPWGLYLTFEDEDGGRVVRKATWCVSLCFLFPSSSAACRGAILCFVGLYYVFILYTEAGFATFVVTAG